MPSFERNYRKYKWEKWRDLYKLKNYVVLDTETTGLSYETEEIIEIAIAKVCDGELVDEFSSLVNPGKKLSARITKITGITDSDLADAPSFREIAQQIVDFIGASVILAHNASFDLNFLCRALDQCKISYSFECLDTVQVAKKAYPGFENHKLETLIHKLGLADSQTHRAMDDVRCTLKLFQGICEKYNNPLVEAISSCCSPISDYRLVVREAPLKDLRIALIGTFTFPYSAAKKLIAAAGGLVVNANAPDADYLVHGYIDPLEYPTESETLLKLTSAPRVPGSKPILINEVALLTLCGVSFYD